MTIAERYLSSEASNALARLLKDIKWVENLRWHHVEDKTKVSENILTRFLRGEGLSKVSHLQNVFSYVETYLEENPASAVWQSSADDIRKLFGGDELPGENVSADRYAALKAIAQLSEDEQKKLSQEAAGSYVVIRRNPEVGFLVAHLRIMNTYQRAGLPTSRFSRRLVNAPGEVIADGSVWRNNGHLHIIGYDISTNELHSLQVEPRLKNYRASIGFLTGYERDRIPFTTKLVMIRASKQTRYSDVKAYTGGAATLEDATSMAIGLGVEFNEDLDGYVDYLDNVSYVALTDGK